MEDSEEMEQRDDIIPSPDILKHTKLTMQDEITRKVNNDSNSTMDGLGKAVIVGNGNLEESSKSDSNPNETDVFLTKFCTEQDGHAYKICPEKWTIDDQGFGIWWEGDCQPKSFQDIRKTVRCETEGLQQQMTDKEIFFRWAESIGRHKSGTVDELDQIPQVIERVKIRELKSIVSKQGMKIDMLERKSKE